jgi:hypothetical protein
MNCEAVQNRLLALPDLRRVPDELRTHLDGCPACRAFLAKAVRLDALVAAVPVPPPSAEARAALLERVAEAGPVIKRVPVVRRDSMADLPAYLAEDGRWKYAAALAAAVLVAVGWLAVREDATTRAPDYNGVAGHALLTKTIGKVATDKEALARARTSEERMRVWAAVTGDLRDEVENVYRYAGKDDLKALAGLFDKAAERGLLDQARKVADDQTPPDRRRAAFRDAIGRMDKIAADTETFARTAPEDRKPVLRQIGATAKRVRDELNKLEPRLAGAPPGKGA